jgi:hypothetical protein
LEGFYMQVFGDLCVVSYWINTLVLKLREILISTLLHHPFLFKEKINASSRSSNGDGAHGHYLAREEVLRGHGDAVCRSALVAAAGRVSGDGGDDTSGDELRS